MKRNEDNQKSFHFAYLPAVLFYLAALASFIAGNENSLGFVWLGLGSAFLCLGAVHSNHPKENKDHKE